MISVVIILGCCQWAFGQDSSEAVEAGSYISKFLAGGGWLVWVVLLPLSVVTVRLIVQYFLIVRRSKWLPVGIVEVLDRHLNPFNLPKALQVLQGQGGVLPRALHAGLVEAKNGRAAMDLAMAEMLEQDTTSMLRRIEWLNIIGNVAPMIGLFGTVWGMINAFDGIVQAGGQPEPADLAGGISVALVTTWWGLIVAIPALAAYGSLRNRIDALAAEIAVVADNVLRDINIPSGQK